jgi:outer membrane protein assembly factor BamC
MLTSPYLKNKKHPVQIFSKYAFALYCTITLSACANFNEVVSGDKVDYKSGLQTTSNLEIPPTVTRPNINPAFSAPDTQSFNQFVKEREAQKSGGVLPSSTIARIEREGSKRWLVVNLPADEVWPKLEKFWNDLGFKLENKNPETGIMETNWLENKAGAPNDGFRRLLSSIMSMAFSTDKKDKFRTRIERAPNNETEIYLTHSGVEEQFSDKKQEDTKYISRPQDTELEAEILSKMIIALGMNQNQADYLKQNYLNNSANSPEKTGLLNTAQATQTSASDKTATVSTNVGNQLNLNSNDINTASRRLGMAIDSAAFKIISKNNDIQNSFWLVDYINPEQFNQQLGFWKRLKGQNVDDLRKARQFKISIIQNNQQNFAQVEPQTSAKNTEEVQANERSRQAILAVLAEHLQITTK